MSNRGENYLVVSCDGGGIRGVMTAMLLKDLGPEVLDRVRLYAGTSTGMLVSLALAAGRTPADLIEFYRTQCSTFFRPYDPQAEPEDDPSFIGGDAAEQARRHGDLEEARRRLAEILPADLSEVEKLSGSDRVLAGLGDILERLLYPVYSSAGAREALATILPETTLGEIWECSGKRVLATTYYLGDRKTDRSWSPRLCHNLPDLPSSGASDRLSLLDIACAAAAPAIYYRPFRLPDGELCMDAGTYVNNPAQLAVTLLYASKRRSDPDFDLDRIQLLSIGTGLNPARYPITDGGLAYYLPRTYPYGLLGWAWPRASSTSESFPLLGAIYDGVSQATDGECEDLLEEGYRRADPPLGGVQISLDDCSRVDDLMELAAEYIAGEEWCEIKEWLG